ncbi:MAG: hypothetical protein Q7S89_03535, partial [bacterium]|nr:hypothetical protein [bacterium]
SGKVVGAGVPRAYLIAFEPGAAYFIEATDIGGCGVSSEEQIYSTVQLPKGVRVSPALLGIIEISFYVPGGNMVIGPQCPVDRVCVAPCDVSDVAASDVTFSIPLVHDNGQEDTITFDMIRGVVE